MADPDDGAERPSPPAPTARRSTALLTAVVLAVVFFATTVLLGVVAVGLKSDKDELADQQTAVRSVSERFVDAFLEYDYRNPDASIETVLSLTAPPFTEQFEEAVPALQESFETAEQVSTGTVRDVFVAEVDPDGSAIAIVVYDRRIDGTGGPREETNLYLRLGLVERDGDWRVNDVINLNLAIAGAGSETPTTG